jgi:NitT/TauT family transport system substrate-binding protein
MRGGAPAGILVAFVLAVAACGGSAPERVAGPTPTPDLTPVTVKVGHVASTQWAPLYVAIERGYFQRLNVNVQLQSFRLGQDPVDLVSRGQVDVALTDFSAGMFNGLGAGLKFKVVGSMAAIPAKGAAPIQLEVARTLLDRGTVRTLADLKGRKIAIAGGAGSGGGYLAGLALQPAGVRLRDMTVIDLAATDMEEAFKIGSIDAALSPAPYWTSMEQHGVAAGKAAPPAGTTWSGVLYGARLTGSAGLRFFQALVRGARDLVGPDRTSDDTLGIVSRYTGTPAGVLKTVPPYDWDDALEPDTTALAGLQASYRALGLLEYGADLPPSRIVDATYSKRAAPAVH